MIQDTNPDEFDDMSQIGLPYVRSSSNISSKTTPNRNRRSHNNNNIESVSPRPTEFLCRLIRKVYSTNEIVAGITQDERLDRIKGKIENLFYFFYEILLLCRSCS